MAERIWIRQKGRLEGVQKETFRYEHHLQELIAEHPELIDGEQVRPDDARRWILIAHEKGIAETSDAGARWSLDHLIIDQDARPTLVEAKLDQWADRRHVRYAKEAVAKGYSSDSHGSRSVKPDAGNRGQVVPDAERLLVLGAEGFVSYREIHDLLGRP